MRSTEVDISALMSAAGIAHKGVVTVTDNMSGLETEPKDDWLYIGLCAIRDAAREKSGKITSIASIGSGNGIETIAELLLIPELKNVTVTDVLQEILGDIRRNIERNIPPETLDSISIEYAAGRDCEPVSESVDLIYGNLPLIMVDDSELETDRATTTLTAASAYAALSQGPDDPLEKYSLLSQLGFLLSAKEKLNAGGSIITLIGGRVPYEAIDETFKRAGLEYKELSCAFKRQSDPEFLREYADYETTKGVTFQFYDYEKAAEILRRRKIKVPNIIQDMNGAILKELLQEASLNANQAYAFAMTGQNIGHIAFGFEAWKPTEAN